MGGRVSAGEAESVDIEALSVRFGFEGGIKHKTFCSRHGTQGCCSVTQSIRFIGSTMLVGLLALWLRGGTFNME